MKFLTGDQRLRKASHERDWDTLLSLKDIQHLSRQDSSLPDVMVNSTMSFGNRLTVSPSTVTNQPYDVPQIRAKVPKSYIPSVLLPSVVFGDIQATPYDEICSISGFSNNSHLVQEGKHIRPNPNFRPRAVVSSEENDALIGYINKTAEVQHLAKLKSESRSPSHLYSSFRNGRGLKKSIKSMLDVKENEELSKQQAVCRRRRSICSVDVVI